MKQKTTQGTANGIEIQKHLEKIYDELILETYGKRK